MCDTFVAIIRFSLKLNVHCKIYYLTESWGEDHLIDVFILNLNLLRFNDTVSTESSLLVYGEYYQVMLVARVCTDRCLVKESQD